MKLYRKEIQRISFHLIYWVIFSVFFPVFMTFFLNRATFTFEVFKHQFLALIYGYLYFIPTVYFISYFLIPKLIQKRRILLFAIISLSILFILAILDDLSNIYIFMPKYSPEYIEYFKENIAFKPAHLFIVSILLLAQITPFILIKLLKEYFTNFFEKQQLKQQVTDSELKMLKSQLHPHFLFNTLNNIYSLSTDCHDPLIPKSIERISSILRYSLYECDSETVALCNEIKIIRDYIELERIRYSKISIESSFPKDTNNIYIIPLLLFTFIENAFKHGTSNSIKNKWIKINLEVIHEKLLFTITNSKNKKNNANLKNYKEGIGLKNAIKRLELYYGSDNFTLTTKESEDSFEVKLKLNLKK